jgi:hypothetical protein
MKKTIALIALTGLLFVSCKKEEKTAETAVKNPNLIGINISKSDNIEIVKKLNVMATTYDFANFKSNFTADAILHDNMNDVTIDENIKMLETLKSKGITVKLDEKPLIWESIRDKPNEKTGISNYVISYYELTFARNGKSAKINFNMVFAMKDGKVQEEWDTYDSAPLLELLK